MNTDLTDQVHDAFVRRANDVEAPPIDHVAFEAQVGRARTRRRAGVAGAVAAVAAVSAVTLTAGLGLSDLTATPAPPVGSSAPDPAGPVAPLRSKVVWVDEGSVVLYGRPTTHRFDSDAFGRFEDAYRTIDGVLVVDAESGLVRITLSGNGSAKAPLSSRDVTAPVDGAVQAVAVSRDGRTAAWLTLGDQLVPCHQPDGRGEVWLERVAVTYFDVAGKPIRINGLTARSSATAATSRPSPRARAARARSCA